MPDALARVLAAYIRDHGAPNTATPTPVAGVMAICSTGASAPFAQIYRPSICVVAQGAKRIEVADRVLDYAAGSALVVNLETPGRGGVTAASPGAPFYGMTIDLDPGLMREVLAAMPAPPPSPHGAPGLFVEALSPETLDCLTRLARLFDDPQAAPVLAPATLRELYFRLLSGPNGAAIARLARGDGHMARIAAAIHAMRGDLTRGISVADMAAAAGMGVSSFHQHFRAVTALSPLQYLKSLRLLEARRLMVAEDVPVTQAALRVGYESPSQFSREYARHFGSSPRRDAEILRELAFAL